MAIAFDASTKATTGSGGASSLTWSHTNSGNFLVVTADTFDENDSHISVTYAGVTMTKQNEISITSTNRRVRVYTLASPATGANNVVISENSGNYMQGAAESYSGVLAVDATATSNPGVQASPFAPAITTIADNCWVHGSFHVENNTSLAASTNTTQRQNQVLTGSTAISTFSSDTNAAQTPAGSKVQTITYSTNNRVGSVLLSMSPIVPSGPAGMKTRNGLATASIKAVNGLSLASIKSINGLT